jgi:hypothetical protein
MAHNEDADATTRRMLCLDHRESERLDVVTSAATATSATAAT